MTLLLGTRRDGWKDGGREVGRKGVWEVGREGGREGDELLLIAQILLQMT